MDITIQYMAFQMSEQWTWVDNDQKMLDARNKIRGSARLCLDTEYDSFRYFRERLCLIQIKAQNMTYLLDPLKKIDMGFLGDAFSDPDVLIITHAGDNDIRILKRDYAFDFKNIFDTQRAASLLGCQYLSLAAVINQYLGIEFDKKKKLQRSQWDSRPLSDEQLLYAVQDTLYLEPLYEVLHHEIKQKGLSDELKEILEKMTTVNWHEKPFDCMGYRRIKENRALTPNQRQCLKGLYEWRFQKAKEKNKAMFMILSDNDLIELCKGEPDSVEDLRAIGKLSCKKISSFGSDIIGIMKYCRLNN
ncbi:MAG: ribonuclease D [Syntrophaceae bacterium]|nr:ribonuclease D [Syntrophaceae bacterium]